MNIEEVEKIKGLIKTSAILSAPERAEWLALFDLMNDKQLGELEKILSGEIRATPTTPSFAKVSEGKPSAAKIPLPSSVGNNAAPRSTPPSQGGVPPLGGEAVGVNNLAKSRIVAPKMPKLSHIVNLPNLMPNFPKAALDKQVPFSPEKIARDLAQKKPSAFMGKLKSMFAEKELPAGHPEFELELPEGQYPQFRQGSGGQAISNIQYPPKNPILRTEQKPQIISTGIKPMPPVPPIPPRSKIVPKPEIPTKPVVEPLKPVDLRKDFSLDKILKLEQKPQVKIPAAPALIRAPSPVATSEPAGATATPAPAPAINFPKTSDADESRVIKDLKDDLRDKQPAAPLQPASPPLANEQALNSLQDLTKIEAETLQGSALDALVKKIKSLIGKYGYFEVIFNIEKSQAFKSYIATGLKLLSGKDSFDNLALESGGAYLSKAQFEKFTDLLAKIQAS